MAIRGCRYSNVNALWPPLAALALFVAALLLIGAPFVWLSNRAQRERMNAPAQASRR
jgi:hypothetical protein